MEQNTLLEGLIPQGLTGPPRLGSCLGLFISPDGIELAAASVQGGKPTVDKVVTIPFGKAPPLEGEAAKESAKKRTFFTTDFLANKEMVAQAIRRGVDEIGSKSRDVVATFSHHLSITRYFLMPPVDKRFWKSSVPLEAKKYVPFPMEGLAVDFQVTASVSEAKKNFMGVLLGVTPQLALNQVVQIAKEAGLRIIAVEPSPCSVLRLWRNAGAAGSNGETMLQVHFEPTRAHVILTREGLPLLCREVDLPADEYALSQKTLDLVSAINFAEKYLGIEAIGRVKVSGAGDLAPRMEMITREISIPVEKAALSQAVPVQWGAFASVGAAMRALADSPINVDFTQTGRMRDEDKSLILIWSVGFGAFLLFALLGFWNQFQIIRQKQQMAVLTQQAADAGVTQGMTAEDLQSKINRMRSLVDTMDLMVQREPLAPKLQQLVDRIPENIWLESLQYGDMLKPGEPSQRTLMLNGAAQYGSRERDILEANAFKQALTQDPLFIKGFKKVDISYKVAEGAVGGGGSTQKLQTDFTLNVGPDNPRL